MDHKAMGSFTWFVMNLPYWHKSQMQLSFERMEISQVSLTQHSLNHCSVGILPLASKRVNPHAPRAMLKAADNRSPACGKQPGKHVGKTKEKGKLTFLAPPSLWSDLWELPPYFIYWVASRLNSNKQRPVRCQDICIESLSFSPSSVKQQWKYSKKEVQWLKEVTVTIIFLLHWGTSLVFLHVLPVSLCHVCLNSPSADTWNYEMLLWMQKFRAGKKMALKRF